MTKKIHISPNGPRPCRADPNNPRSTGCGYPNTPHFDDMASAEAAFAKTQGGALGAPLQKSGEKADPPESMNDPWKSHADTTNTTAGDTRCLVCAAHPGWAHADESRRDSQRDCCAACLGSGTRQVFTVATYPEAARIAGHMAGKLGGVWTRNNAGTTIIVAANTSPDGLSRANRWATVKVTKGGKDHDREQVVLSDIRARLQAGQTPTEVAAALNDLPHADWRTRSGKPWTAANVKKMGDEDNDVSHKRST